MLLRCFVVLSIAVLSFAVQGKTVLTGKSLITDQKLELEAGNKGTVIVFMSAKCPCSNSHIGIMKKLSEEFRDFNFIVVHSNTDESIEESKAYFKNAGFNFPVVQDENGQLADRFKALKTPHAFLLSAEGTIIYKGGVTSSTSGETADKQFLKDALTEAKEGKPIRVAESRTLGCIIERGRKHAW